MEGKPSEESWRGEYKNYLAWIIRAMQPDTQEYVVKEVESFIENLLEKERIKVYDQWQVRHDIEMDLAIREERQRIIGIIEGMRIKNPVCYCKTHPEHNCGVTSNEALDDISKSLQS